MIEPSTPVMKDTAISCGNEVAVGRLGTLVDEEGPGASKAMPTIGSWSSNVSEGNRRAISLRQIVRKEISKAYSNSAPLIFFAPSIFIL